METGKGEKTILVLRSVFQSDAWLQEEYGELLALLARETGCALCVCAPDSDEAVRVRARAAAADTVLVATGGVENLFVELMPHLARDARPLALLADGRNNSLAAALEILTYLRAHQRAGRIVHAPTSAELVHSLLNPSAAAAAADTTLQEPPAEEDIKGEEGNEGKSEGEGVLAGCRVACVGRPSDWLVASDVDRGVLAARYGVAVVDVPLDAVVARYEGVDGARVDALVAEYLAHVAFVTEPAREDVARSLRLYAALRDLCAAERVCALTVRCFDIVGRLGATACVALSMLNDEGIVAGCEGDMQALLTMLLARRLLGAPAFMANPSRAAAGATVLAHCTVPRTMCTALALRSHFESGRGVAPQGTLPAGPAAPPYTLVKWGGAALDRAFVAEAPAVPVAAAAHDEHLCRTQVTLALDTRPYLLARPIGNHHILVAGAHAAALCAFFRAHGVHVLSCC